MDLRFSDIYKPSKATHKKYNFFDPCLYRDSKYYIDPLLIKSSKNKIIKSGHSDILIFYKALIKILQNVKVESMSDPFWREAVRKFSFKEISGFYLGYSKSSFQGSGLTSTLAERILITSRKIIEAGVNDPEIFSLIGFLEEGIGADRISDMTSNILLNKIAEYTLEIVNNCQNKNVKKFKIANSYYELPFNPKTNDPILLVPEDVLKHLPEAHDYSDIDAIVSHNAGLRQRVNQLVGNEWSKVSKNDLKKAVKKELLASPKIIEEIIKEIHKNRKSYDFRNDPKRQEYYRKYLPELVAFFNKVPREENESVKNQVATLINNFKEAIENNNLAKCLYDDNGKVLKELHSQKIFHAIGLSYFEKENIVITPEANAGRGPVDFLFSRGKAEKVLVEFKLSSNDISKGIQIQLPEYIKAEKPAYSYYVVIQIGDHDKKIKNFLDFFKNMKRNDIGVIVIEGRPKSSASHM